MGDIIDDENIEQIEQSNERAAGAPEGTAPTEPSADEIAELYEATGVKAPVPTGKAKGRPKTTDVRAKDAPKKGAGNSDSGSEKDDDDKNKSKNAPNSNDNGNSGNKANSKGSKNGEDDESLQDESGDADKGVRGAKSRGEGDSERRGEDGSERRDERTGQEERDEGAASEKTGDDEENIKRPGKSNPEVEKRFQQLTAEKRAAEQRAIALEERLQEQHRVAQQSKIAQEDPEYTIDDFRKVRDNATGEIRELDAEQAELAWRRWQDGYNQRGEQRQAEVNRMASQQEREGEIQRRIMKESSDAYDSLAGLMDDYPELVSTSGQFDEEFAAEAMPIIHEALEYLPGTEPGNEEGRLPVIVGMKLHPKKILDALKKVGSAKRTLPLNGTHDNVESGSSVSVPHSRSSDPTVNAANDLMKQLNINKRF